MPRKCLAPDAVPSARWNAPVERRAAYCRGRPKKTTLIDPKSCARAARPSQSRNSLPRRTNWKDTRTRSEKVSSMPAAGIQ